MATEKLLIDANAFEEAHCFGCPYRLEESCTKDDPICATIDDLRDFPRVDAVEVVRCKDCRFWHKDTVSCEFVTSDTNWYEEDFCSYGERKSDED